MIFSKSSEENRTDVMSGGFEKQLKRTGGLKINILYILINGDSGCDGTSLWRRETGLCLGKQWLVLAVREMGTL